MANRNFANGGKFFAMHAMPVILDTTITIGSSGAVSSFTGATIASVVRNSTGLYTITFQDPYNRLFFAQGAMRSPSSGLSGILGVEIQNSPSVSTITGGTIQVKTLDAAGALADPASGSKIMVMIVLSNSSVIIPGE
jgi:hypothetical protein